MSKKCYMCNRPATSREHVPPQCLFPEKKDLPDGVTLREQLLTVPSCDLHNLAKSNNDEYLLYILCMNIANNSVAFRHFLTKIMRAFNRKPRLMNSIIDDNQKVIAVDTNGQRINTLMVKADMMRITQCFNQIARAIYYHYFSKPFKGECRSIHDWMIRVNTKASVLVKNGNDDVRAIEHVKAYFKDLDHEGKNESVFRYRFEEPDERGIIALSMQFYGGSNVFIAYLPDA